MKAYRYDPSDYVRACCGVQINAPHASTCATRVCGWPPQHDEEQIDAGISSGGWAHGERMHKLRCRRCGEERGPFITDSGDAGL